MKNLISFVSIAIYTMVCYFVVRFMIYSVLKIDSFVSFIEVFFTFIVIMFLVLTAGIFCYKIVRDKDTF